MTLGEWFAQLKVGDKSAVRYEVHASVVMLQEVQAIIETGQPVGLERGAFASASNPSLSIALHVWSCAVTVADACNTRFRYSSEAVRSRHHRLV